jgi:hypothetical protein
VGAVSLAHELTGGYLAATALVVMPAAVAVSALVVVHRDR